MIIMEKKTYSRTESGKGWKSKPDTIEREEITLENLKNRTSNETARFFGGWWHTDNGYMKGVFRREYGYTYYGYLPIAVTIVNPWKTTKIVETYHITND